MPPENWWEIEFDAIVLMSARIAEMRTQMLSLGADKL